MQTGLSKSANLYYLKDQLLKAVLQATRAFQAAQNLSQEELKFIS